mmetsp:Transcript_119038/g.344284  ORF Transcript_119038/g.344284 Transcript_119038/m.344284 type:complete len:324 (-) Transcript_119038:289-1260(-)
MFLLRLVPEEVQGPLRRRGVGSLLDEPGLGLHGRGRQTRVLGLRVAHACDLGQNLDSRGDGLLLRLPRLRPLRPLGLLHAAGLGCAVQAVGIRLEVGRRTLQIRVGLSEGALRLALDRVLLVVRGLLRRAGLLAGFRRQLEGVDGVRFLSVHLRKLVFELELQLFEQLDDAVGLEAVLLDVPLVVALRLCVRPVLRLVNREALQLAALLLGHPHAQQLEHLPDLLLGEVERRGVRLRSRLLQGGNRLPDGFDRGGVSLAALLVQLRTGLTLLLRLLARRRQLSDLVLQLGHLLGQHLDRLLVRRDLILQSLDRRLLFGDGLPQ